MLHSEDAWTRVHAAVALWDIGGETEADVVVQALLGAWEDNDTTSRDAVACLYRMGQAAEPALPRIQKTLALPRRSGQFGGGVAPDEELQHTCRAILTRLQGRPHHTPPKQ